MGLPLALLALGAVLALVPWPATWVEQAFSRGLFPLTSRVLAPIVGAAAFSVTGLLALAVVAALLVGWLVDRRGAGSRRRLTCVWLPWLAAVLLLGFTLTWGLAYRRAARRPARSRGVTDAGRRGHRRGRPLCWP
ncbi:MAG: DUF3810 family protein [Deinococcales bacterium]